MSRSEWWTIIILAGLGDFLLVMILVYLSFIWSVSHKQYSIMWRQAFDEDIQKLHMGDLEIREYGEGHGGGVGGSEPDIQKSLRDAGPRGPFIY